MSAIAEALRTLDVIRLEISAYDGGSADVPECLQIGQYYCISPTVDIFAKSSYSGKDMFRYSIDIQFSQLSHKTALYSGSRPCLQPAQKSSNFFGLNNFRLQSRLGAMLLRATFRIRALVSLFFSYSEASAKKNAAQIKTQRE